MNDAVGPPAATPLPALGAGLLCGCIAVIYAVADAALLFGGPLEAHLGIAVGLCLFAAAVLAVVGSLTSRIDGAILGGQEVAVLICALMLSELTPDRPDGGDALLATAVATLACATLVVGAALFLLGRCRLGNVIRFVPFPVIAGFLAGSGVLLAVSALGVIGGGADAGVPTEPDLLARFGFAALLTGGLFWTVRRPAAGYLLPAVIAAATAGCHALLYAASAAALPLRPHGWLFTASADGGLWPPLAPDQFAAIDWYAVLGQLPAMLALALVSALALMMKLHALEHVCRRRIDFDREFRAAGVANLAAGGGGGVGGFHVLTMTAIVYQVGAARRWVGAVAAAVIAAPLLLDAGFIAYLPRPVFGAILLWIGLELAREWLLTSYRRLQAAERLIVVGIIAIICLLGFTEGIVIGMAATIGYFVFTLSRIDVVRRRQSGVTLRSGGFHTAADAALLDRRGKRLAVLRLGGYLFFGSVHRLEAGCRGHLAMPLSREPRYLLLDFSQISGVDSSAAQKLVRLWDETIRNGDALALVAVNRHSAAALRAALPAGDGRMQALVFDDLDAGLRWAEERLLGDADGAAAAARPAGDAPCRPPLLADDACNRALFGYCTRLSIRAGERLICSGDPPDALYFLARGRVAILVDDAPGPPLRVRSLGAGAILGELPLYLGGTRSASVQAETDCSVWRLRYATLAAMEAADPALAAGLHKAIAATLALRLKDTNRVISLLNG